MSKPFGGHYERRQDLTEDLDDPLAIDQADAFIAQLEDGGYSHDVWHRVRANLQRKLNRDIPIAGLTTAAMQRVLRILTYRLGG